MFDDPKEIEASIQIIGLISENTFIYDSITYLFAALTYYNSDSIAQFALSNIIHLLKKSDKICFNKVLESIIRHIKNVYPVHRLYFFKILSELIDVIDEDPRNEIIELALFHVDSTYYIFHNEALKTICNYTLSCNQSLQKKVVSKLISILSPTDVEKTISIVKALSSLGSIVTDDEYITINSIISECLKMHKDAKRYSIILKYIMLQRHLPTDPYLSLQNILTTMIAADNSLGALTSALSCAKKLLHHIDELNIQNIFKKLVNKYYSTVPVRNEFSELMQYIIDNFNINTPKEYILTFCHFLDSERISNVIPVMSALIKLSLKEHIIIDNDIAIVLMNTVENQSKEISINALDAIASLKDLMPDETKYWVTNKLCSAVIKKCHNKRTRAHTARLLVNFKDYISPQNKARLLKYLPKMFVKDNDTFIYFCTPLLIELGYSFTQNNINLILELAMTCDIRSTIKINILDGFSRNWDRFSRQINSEKIDSCFFLPKRFNDILMNKTDHGIEEVTYNFKKLGL